MRVWPRVLIWLIETICEALLLGAFLLAFTYVSEGGSDIRFVHDVFVIAFAIAFMFLMTGYLLTTLIARALWKGQRWWGYSLAAAALFVVHFEIMNAGVGGAFDVAERWSIRVFGVFVAFGCTLGGTRLLSNLEYRSQAGISNAH